MIGYLHAPGGTGRRHFWLSFWGSMASSYSLPLSDVISKATISFSFSI